MNALTGMASLEVRNLSVSFASGAGRVEAVRNAGWSLAAGETLAIIGESGSGKSVTAAAILGLIDMPPGRIEGSVFFDGQDLLTLSPRQRQDINGRRIAMIFQDPLASLNPVFTVGWQIVETMRLHGVSADTARKRAIQLLERVGITPAEKRASDYPHQFSGGQRQRIMIAMAIAMQPSVLVADEPTSSLDVTVQAQILSLLKELQHETGMGLIIITHDIAIARQIADRVVVMHDGEVVEAGPARAVLDAPQHDYTKSLLAAVPDGRPLPEPRPAPTGPALLTVKTLRKSYNAGGGLFRRRRKVLAVDDVDLSLFPREIVCLVGESGSGKSSLIKTLLRLEPANGGEVLFNGRDVLRLPEAALPAFRRDVQMVFQDPTASLNPRMTVAEIIAEPWNIHPDALPRSEWPAEIERLLLRVGLKREHASRHPHEFSGGQRQRIAIARALALKPRLIVCDEAVSALDASVQARVLDLLRSLRDEAGVSLLFITHDLGLVRNFADRVLVMQQGRIVEEGDVRQIFGQPQHPYTRQLLESHAGLVKPMPIPA
jgi:peptide/nickel transport system ATP-binding protein